MMHHDQRLGVVSRRRECCRQPRVLVLCDYYLPSCYAGGPVQSLANLVSRLGDRIGFRLITRDRDLGSNQPFHHLPQDEWTTLPGVKVIYASPFRLNPISMWKWINATPHDVLYLNSLFSPWFTIVPLLLRRFGLLPPATVVLAPRGELALSALRQKAWRKAFFRRLAQCLRLYHGVHWQATSPHEMTDIRREFGLRASVSLAPVLSPLGETAEHATSESVSRKEKQPGMLRVLFLSRIHPIKNLHFAIRCLNGLRGRIDFTIHGPVHDPAYWHECVQELKRLPNNIRWHYPGPVARDHLDRVYQRHHVLLLPTQGENFGHVILEALLAGCSVIVSDQTPWRHLRSRGCGWDLSLEDIGAFRAALQELVDSGDRQFQAVSRAARAQAEAFCGNDQSVHQNLGLFQSHPQSHAPSVFRVA